MVAIGTRIDERGSRALCRPPTTIWRWWQPANLAQHAYARHSLDFVAVCHPRMAHLVQQHHAETQHRPKNERGREHGRGRCADAGQLLGALFARVQRNQFGALAYKPACHSVAGILGGVTISLPRNRVGKRARGDLGGHDWRRRRERGQVFLECRSSSVCQ